MCSVSNSPWEQKDVFRINPKSQTKDSTKHHRCERFVDVNTTNTRGRFTRVRRCCFCRPVVGTRCQRCCKKRQDMGFCTCNIKNCVKHRKWMLIWPAQLKLVGSLPQTFEDPHREWQRRQRQSAPCCQTGGNRVLVDFWSCGERVVCLKIYKLYLFKNSKSHCDYLDKWASLPSSCRGDHRSATHVHVMYTQDHMRRSILSCRLVHCWNSWCGHSQELRAQDSSILGGRGGDNVITTYNQIFVIHNCLEL